MIRDPFYRAIINRLGGQLDPEIFEQCAADILRDEWPTLVPIRGGSDSGMDGAIGDGQGQPFPLITTTSNDVIGNLTRNLASYVDHGGLRRHAVLATSRALSTTRRKNLNDRAHQKGFTLVQIYDQHAIADRLYRHPGWCRELLNLTGAPRALSRIPLTSRPFIEATLIGRETDMDWLNKTEGDRLLSGQPGSGKTFLLRALADAERALFLVSDSREEIASALRELKPPAIIVDDAHIKTDLLTVIRHLRDETGISFDIIASCWPGDVEPLAVALNLTTHQVRSLNRLTRDEIVAVIKSAGLAAPDQLIGQIVNQAEGLPGLATTLTHLCLRGDIRQVALGEALKRTVRSTLEPLIGKRAVNVLAAFAFGGNAGMQPEVVARSLGVPLIDLQQDLIGLSAGGVILQMSDRSLSVRPRDLRYPLLRDVFFAGPLPLPSQDLIQAAEDKEQLAMVLIATQVVGGAVRQETIMEALEQSHSPHAWSYFARLGRREAELALRSQPEMLLELVRGALDTAPTMSLTMLMDRGIGDHRNQHSWPEHPIRIIGDWVRAAHPGSSRALARRKEAILAAKDWLLNGKDESVGMQVLATALAPDFQIQQTGPGSTLIFNLTSGLLLDEQLNQFEDLWRLVTPLLSARVWRMWDPLLDALETWRYPGSSVPSQSISQETTQIMKQQAAAMLQDVAVASATHLGAQHRLKAMLKSLHSRVDLHLDPEFEVLFPDTRRADWRTEEQRQIRDVEDLANRWADEDPQTLCKRLLRFDTEATEAGLSSRRNLLSILCEHIAAQTPDPLAWAKCLVGRNAVAEHVAPFLLAARGKRTSGYDDLVTRCFDTEYYRHLATYAVLTQAEPQEASLDSAIEYAAALNERLDFMCHREQIPKPTLIRLLHHPDVSVAATVAIGIWQATHRNENIDGDLEPHWREVITHCTLDDDYHFRDLLRNNPQLADEWLRNQLNDDTRYKSATETEMEIAGMLNGPERHAYIEKLPDNLWGGQLLAVLVGRDVDLYNHLLSLNRSKRFHLIPLQLSNDTATMTMIVAALDHGYTEDDVFIALTPKSWSWAGLESDFWADWENGFAALQDQSDPRICSIAGMGMTWATHRRDFALRHEHIEAVYGLDGL